VNKVTKVTHIEVTACARCGGDHAVSFRTFANPPEFDSSIYDWWGTCPVTGEPILMRMEQDARYVAPAPPREQRPL
jgi:hypothetical protein